MPAQLHLHSRLRTVYNANLGISTSFAWLGYGTFVRRQHVVEFLDLLDQLQLSDEERKMADNYYTILMNRIPEIWFDHSIELSGGQAFTVGEEGDARNERHIVRW